MNIDWDAALRAARDKVFDDPVATSWVDRVLKNHVARRREIRNLPEALARKLGLDPDEPVSVVYMLALAPMLASAVANRCFLDESRAMRVSVEDAVGFADLAIRQETNRETFSHADIQRIRNSEPVTEWHGQGHRSATIRMGRLAIRCNFSGFRNGTWELGWRLSEANERSLEKLTKRGTGGRREPGTGLFPYIDTAVRSAIREFLETHEPTCLLIRGSDAKRNAHYLSTYGSIAPEDYELVPIFGGSARAGPDGVDGIRLVRHPKPAAVPGMA